MSSPSCPRCNDTGWMPSSKDGRRGVVRCDCYKQARIPRLVEYARIPPHFATATLENYHPPNPSLELAKLAAEHFVKEYPTAVPQGLMFMGRPGLGKTHLAVGIIQALIRTKGVPCLFCDFPDLLREIQNSYNPLTHGSEALILAPILDAEVLVLDDLGSQKWSEWVQDMLAHVINDRYKHGHATIFTTNYLDPPAPSRKGDRFTTHQQLKEWGVIDDAGQIDQFRTKQLIDLGVLGEKENWLQNRIGDRLRSRLTQMCKEVEMSGEDFRRTIRTRKIR